MKEDMPMKSPKVLSKIISVKLNDERVTLQTICNYLKQMEIIKMELKRISIITMASMLKRL